MNDSQGQDYLPASPYFIYQRGKYMSGAESIRSDDSGFGSSSPPSSPESSPSARDSPPVNPFIGTNVPLKKRMGKEVNSLNYQSYHGEVTEFHGRTGNFSYNEEGRFMAKRMEPDEGFDSGNYSQDIPPKTVPLDLSRGSRDNNVSSSSSSSRQHSEDPHQSFGQQNSAIRIEDSSQSHALTTYPTDGAEKPEFRIQVQADSYPSSQRGSPIALAGQQVVSNQIPVSLQYPFHRNTILAAPSASSANNFGRELPRDQHNSDFNNVAESMAQLPNRHLIQNVDNTFMLSVNGQMLQSQLSQSPRLGLSSPYDNTQDQLLLSSPLATFPVMPPVSSIINRKRRNEVREKKDNSKSASGTVASAETSSSSSREAGEDPDAKKAKAVPEDQKDEAYWERRRKNNEAAKRSRDARRQKEEEIASRANFLEQENLKLRAEIHVLKSETAKLHYMIFQTRM